MRSDGDMSVLCAEALVGFRYWYVGLDRLLHPINGYHEPWPVRGLTARCRLARYRDQPTSCGMGDAPSWGCQCGIHAYYSLSQVPEAFYGLRGTIACWGRIVEHDRGFRAEHARVVALEDGNRPGGYTDIAGVTYSHREVAARYDVPLLPPDELVQYAEWWGEVRPPVPH